MPFQTDGFTLTQNNSLSGKSPASPRDRIIDPFREKDAWARNCRIPDEALISSTGAEQASGSQGSQNVKTQAFAFGGDTRFHRARRAEDRLILSTCFPIEIPIKIGTVLRLKSPA